MGTVYEAIDPEIERRVAIKVLRHDLLEKNPELLKRLFVEARAANAIGHPGVVQISEAGRLADGSGFLVMELLQGQTLTQLMRQAGGRLRVEVAVPLAIQIASTLRTGHLQGVIHRDLKPDNIMLVPDDAVPGGERVKLLDFGIAKMGPISANAESLTLADMGLGTPGYMAPEQMRDAAASSPRSDVYGLGAVLFEALSGQRPHVADNHVDLMVLVLSTDAPLLSDLMPEIPTSLSELLAQMLRRQPPEARPDMVEVLRRLYLINIELTTLRRTGPVSGDVSTVSAAPLTAPTQPPEPLPKVAGDQKAKSIPPVPVASAVAAPTSVSSASTPSQMRGQQVGKPPRWRLGVLASVGAVVLVLSLLRSNQQQLPIPPVPDETSIGSAPPTPHLMPTPTAPRTAPAEGPSANPPADPPGKEPAGAPAEPLKPSGPVATPMPPHPALVSHPGCESRSPRSIDPADPAVTRAVQEAIKAYHLRLCKGERLVLSINSGDSSLTVARVSPGVKARTVFDANSFGLRIQGTLPAGKLLPYKQITIAY